MPSPSDRPIRVWPGLLVVLLQWTTILGTAEFAPGTPAQFFGMTGGPPVGVLLLLVWWLCASRARWAERLIGTALLSAGIAIGFLAVHESMRTAVFIWAIPAVCTGFVLAVTLFRWTTSPRRRVACAVAVLAACTPFVFLRSDGVHGDFAMQFAPRWSSTAEQRFLRGVERSVTVGAAATPAPLEAAWPGFRGAARDGVLTGVRIGTDWSAAPPVELWRQPIGPGWGSFAVSGELLFTQEQRGEEEVVACYRATDGEALWLHRDAARFSEALAGPGPRATPTLHGGRVYALGATGILNALEATTGGPVWSRDVATDCGAALPEWGFASSPLIVDDLLIVFSGAPEGKAVVAYDLETGAPRWFAPAGGKGYSSAHLVTLDTVRQVVVLSGDGAVGLEPEDGEVLWRHDWPTGDGARIVQPAFTADGDLLIGTGLGMGMRRVAVVHGADGWRTVERWTSAGLKPYFNDFVVHRGHAYGFDGRLLSCIDLADGERKWKGGRYGTGQLLLLADQELLLVLSEAGELALVRAAPAGFAELGRIPAIEGKTWNHPVLVEGVLYVRNGEEMAAFRL